MDWMDIQSSPKLSFLGQFRLVDAQDKLVAVHMGGSM